MVVTIATVGYGDVTPHTTLGRFQGVSGFIVFILVIYKRFCMTIAMAMISFAIITVPKLTNELIEKMAQQSVYSRAHYRRKNRSTQVRHTVMTNQSVK